jgi:REP element-mobilizing transposase RayT
MNTKFNPDIHHRHSVRLQNYDYSQAGLYYVTICVENRVCMFGNIVDGQIILNEYGQIINNIWNEMPQHYPFAVLHNYVVMPNHFHGIVEITARRGAIYRALDENRAQNYNNRAQNYNRANENAVANDENVGAINVGAMVNQGAINRAPTTSATEKTVGGFAGEKNPMLHNNFSRLIRWFKGRATFECRKNAPHIAWQRNMWEHIIRDAADYARIDDYITNNPFRWKEDTFYNE